MAITQEFLDNAGSVNFTDADSINKYFNDNFKQDFISWFNANAGGQNFWNSIAIGKGNLNIAADFDNLWSAENINVFLGNNSISLLQFLCLQSIINNETGGSLQPRTEMVGRPPDHPGIAYAYDAIPNLKRSYNTLSGNKTCFDLFNNSDYNNAFGALPLGADLMNTTDQSWSGEAYPDGIATSTDPSVTGYILEADFYKFRGRGLIQTTGRTNYSPIVNFVLNYNGTNSMILSKKNSWIALSSDPDVISTISTNDDWNDLFMQTNLIIAAKAINVHNNASGNYLGNISTQNPATSAASIDKMGLRISGGTTYATLFLNRVTQIIDSMNPAA